MPRTTKSKLEETIINIEEELKRFDLKLMAQDTKIEYLKRAGKSIETKHKNLYKFVLICLIVQTVLLLMLLVFSINLV